jgi:hypothetical protein
MTKETVSKKLRGDRVHRMGHKLVGALLALTGIFWFAKKAGWIPVVAGGSGLFWPVLTIGLGILIIVSAGHKRRRHEEKTH